MHVNLFSFMLFFYFLSFLCFVPLSLFFFCVLFAAVLLVSLCLIRKEKKTDWYCVGLSRHSGTQRYETRHFPVHAPALTDNTRRLYSRTHALIHTIHMHLAYQEWQRTHPLWRALKDRDLLLFPFPPPLSFYMFTLSHLLLFVRHLI